MPLSSEYPQATDSHHLRLAREGVLLLWQELPPEQQATLLFTLIHEVMQGEYGRWVFESMSHIHSSQHPK